MRYCSKFPQSSRRSKEKLGLFHSNVCGKMGTKSLGDGKNFLAFIDDKTRYLWICTPEGQIRSFPEIPGVESFGREFLYGYKLKVLRTDNGGEYVSAEFESYLKREGSRHERTKRSSGKKEQNVG